MFQLPALYQPPAVVQHTDNVHSARNTRLNTQKNIDMRNLSFNEITEKLNEYANDIEFTDRNYLNYKFSKFWYFLNNQPITKRILERIQDDYGYLNKKIFDFNPLKFTSHKIEIQKQLKSFEEQGAFAYFILDEDLKKENRSELAELNLTSKWLDTTANYDEVHKDFNTFIFIPFIKLINWYLYESLSYDSNDYFSRKEIVIFSNKLDDLLNDIRLGQEVIFEEIQDLKEQLSNVKKKNWIEIFKGKLFDLTLSKIISIETFSYIFESITGERIKFLE
jgi:hypothetical protein